MWLNSPTHLIRQAHSPEVIGSLAICVIKGVQGGFPPPAALPSTSRFISKSPAGAQSDEVSMYRMVIFSIFPSNLKGTLS